MFRFSRRRRHSRTSRKGSRVGNKITVKGRGGKLKTLKIKVAKDGREFYVTGKTKKKHYISRKRSSRRRSSRRRHSRRRSSRRRHSRRRSSRRRRHSRRRFGYMKNSLLNYMGNFRPSAQMSLAQSTTGFSAPQMRYHIDNTAKNLRANNYV